MSTKEPTLHSSEVNRFAVNTHSVIQRLKEIVQGPESDFDLAEGALLIAKQTCPELEIAGYLNRIEKLTASVRETLGRITSNSQIVAGLNRYLFVEEGFDGNRDDYFDHRNALLNEVLDRKLGMPITLSILYMEIGRRLGLPLKGISFPGHFLVKLRTQEGHVVLDPFSGGMPLTDEDLRRKLTFYYGQQSWYGVSLDRLLVSAGKKEILVRTLRNLKNIYMQKELWQEALSAVETLLAILPKHPMEVRDLALLYDILGYSRGAADSYELYLQLSPEAEDNKQIRERIFELLRRPSKLH